MNDIKLDFDNVLILPKKSSIKSRSDVDLVVNYSFRHSNIKWSGIPIIAANMDTIGTFNIAKILSKYKIITAIHKHYNIDDWLNFTTNNKNILDYVAISTGISTQDYEKLYNIIKQIPEIKMICIDVANGYSSYFIDFVKKCRLTFTNHIIMAGNVVTGEMAKEIINAGADIVKIGIGPGSVCTTRVKTGIGYPQFSAILDCIKDVRSVGGMVISDGGCVVSGDISKAFGAGADFVMLGGMLSGHYECDGELININGKLYKDFYGMSSSTAMNKHNGGVEEYRASEGKHVRIPLKGYIEHTILDMLGGIRSTCTYVGINKLQELKNNTSFIRVHRQVNDVYSKL